MLRTVLHQTYSSNVAVDTSGFFNQGVPILVTPLYPGFSFAEAGSRINIPPSSSLSDLGLIQASVAFALSPHGAAHRYNLIEGYLSFALFVGPDLSISGTILDANGDWTGATSAAGAVTAGANHRATLQSDGISMVRVFLDGSEVASNYSVPGAVRGVGALGIAVGHWPDPPDVYTFEGRIFEVLLQAYDPQNDTIRGVDPCCYDRKAISRWFAAMARKGVSANHLVQAAQNLAQEAKSAAIAMRGGNAGATVSQQDLAGAVSSALSRRDFTAFEAALDQWRQLAGQRLSQADQAQFANNLKTAIDAFGLSWSDWRAFLRLFCLDPCDLEDGGHHHGH